jgi:hypothetical protein
MGEGEGGGETIMSVHPPLSPLPSSEGRFLGDHEIVDPVLNKFRTFRREI